MPLVPQVLCHYVAKALFGNFLLATCANTCGLVYDSESLEGHLPCIWPAAQRRHLRTLSLSDGKCYFKSGLNLINRRSKRVTCKRQYRNPDKSEPL
jgi:hypothetical protein